MESHVKWILAWKWNYVQKFLDKAEMLPVDLPVKASWNKKEQKRNYYTEAITARDNQDMYYFQLSSSVRARSCGKDGWLVSAQHTQWCKQSCEVTLGNLHSWFLLRHPEEECCRSAEQQRSSMWRHVVPPTLREMRFLPVLMREEEQRIQACRWGWQTAVEPLRYPAVS